MPSSLADALSGRYSVERELGRGGMATVWLARDLKHDRLVALKVLWAELTAILGAERFLREIRLTAALQHPHILPLLDSGEAGGVLYYVMPYVEGESLRHRLQRDGQLSLDEALHITRGVSAALEYAHRQGVIHRDIKPENILLYQGEPMVADFGLAILEREPDARLTATGVSLGTPAYMAPEQVAGEMVDGRADVYGLGCVLFEMLTGSPPFTGESAAEIIGRRFRESAPRLRTVRPDLPAAIEAAVAQALAVSPAARFQSVEGFAAALEARGSGSAVRRLTRRHVLAAGLALAVTSVAAGIVTHRVPPVVESATLAVLPVRDLDRGDTSAFAAGLTEDLTAAAAAVPGLLVVSSRSASAVHGETEDLRVIGHRLGVGAVVESTIRVAGERLRMVVRLVRTSDGGVIWSERYDRQRQDVMALQDELAAAVASALRLRYGGGASAGRGPRLIDPAAYQLYARAMQLQQRSRSLQELQRAASLLDSAIARDSTFERAYAPLAWIHLQLVDFGMPLADLEPRIATTLAAGMKVAPDEPRLLAAAGIAAQRAGRRDSAETLLRRAVQLAPGDSWLQIAWAGFLADLLHFDEARRADLLAGQLAPLDPVALSIASWNLVRLGDHTAALQAVDRAIAVDSGQLFNFGIRAMAHACRGEWSDVFGDLHRGQALGFFWQANLGVAHALRGDTAEAVAMAQAVARLAQQGRAQLVSVGWIYAALGWADSAFAWLDRAERGGGAYTGITDFYFDPLAADPRWLPLASRYLGTERAQAARTQLIQHPRCRPGRAPAAGTSP